MGAHPFEHHVKTKASVGEAYSSLREQEGYESGFGGYSGTIATSYGVRIVSTKVVTLAEAEAIYEARIDQCDKWGEAEAVPTYEPLAKNVRKVTRKIKLTAEQLGAGEYLGDGVRKAARAFGATLVREGETLVSAEVVQRKAANGWAESSIDYRTKVVQVPTEGPKQTRYFVQNSYDRRNEWAQGHPTLTAAKAALTKQLGAGFAHRHASATEATFGIVAETRRESGEPLAIVKQIIIGATVEVEYTFVKHVPNPERTGWYIYGLAAS